MDAEYSILSFYFSDFPAPPGECANIGEEDAKVDLAGCIAVSACSDTDLLLILLYLTFRASDYSSNSPDK